MGEMQSQITHSDTPPQINGMSSRIPEETKRAIMDAARIEEVVGDFVALKKRGANYLGLCPFHQEKTPSFIVSPAKGIFKCFGCGKGGDSVSFIMEHEHASYVEALRYLARKYNIEIQEEELGPEARQRESERESLYQVTRFAADFFSRTLWETEEGRNVGLAYFRERRFTDAIIKQFQLGYNPDRWDALTSEALKNGYDKKYLVQSGLTIEKEENGRLFDRFKGRVIFPIHSLSGRVLGFGGRILGNDKSMAKYVNSPESEIYHKSNVLYAIPFAKREIVARDMAYMVEGYADVISMHQAGITNVVASSGTSLTEDQIKLISHFTKNLTLLYDGDPAGIKASLRGIDLVLAQDMNVRVVLLPDGQDPDDFARTHPTEEIRQYLQDNAVDFISFKTRLLLGESGKDPIKRAEVIENILQSLAVLPDRIKRTVYLQECSRLLDVPEADLLDRLNGILRKNFRKQHKGEAEAELLEESGKTADPVRVPDQEKEAEDTNDLVERELLRLMVNQGQQNTTQIYTDEEGNDVPLLTNVCVYIVSEVCQEGFSFTKPCHQALFSIFADSLAKEHIPGMEDLRMVEDPEVRALVADLAASRYELSKHWEEKGIFVKTEQSDRSTLDQAVAQAVLMFKLFRIKEMIAGLDKALARCEAEKDETGLMELLFQKRDLDQRKAFLCGMLRRVVS